MIRLLILSAFLLGCGHTNNTVISAEECDVSLHGVELNGVNYTGGYVKCIKGDNSGDTSGSNS